MKKPNVVPLRRGALFAVAWSSLFGLPVAPDTSRDRRIA